MYYTNKVLISAPFRHDLSCRVSFLLRNSAMFELNGRTIVNCYKLHGGLAFTMTCGKGVK